MTNIYLNGLNNIAHIEFNKPFIQHFYYDFAPTELISRKENHIDQLVYQLYEFTEKEIKIIENA
jgi:hypothetical protein